jgi:hypothetical protein
MQPLNQLVPQNNNFGCGLVAMEYITGIPRATVAEEIGHDGSDIVEPLAPEPYCYACLTPQETDYWLFKRDFWPTRLYSFEYLFNPSRDILRRNFIKTKDLCKELLGRAAEITVMSHKFPGGLHAVAWVFDRVFDPRDGMAKPACDFTILGATLLNNFCAFTRMRQIYPEGYTHLNDQQCQFKEITAEEYMLILERQNMNKEAYRRRVNQASRAKPRNPVPQPSCVSSSDSKD